MDAKEIRELIEVISKSNFSTFELEREGFKLKLEKGGTVQAVSVPAQAVPAAVPLEAPAAAAAKPAESAPSPADSGLVEMGSPIVGTFYRSPGPDMDSFVEVGSRVRKGQVLCIVEAMKLMNEIEAEIDAEIVEIEIQNGQPVEYGETLFRLRPL